MRREAINVRWILEMILAPKKKYKGIVFVYIWGITMYYNLFYGVPYKIDELRNLIYDEQSKRKEKPI